MSSHYRIVLISALIALTACFFLLRSLSEYMGTIPSALLLLFLGLPLVIFLFAIPYTVGCLFFDKPEESHIPPVGLPKLIARGIVQSKAFKWKKHILSGLGERLTRNKTLLYAILGLAGGVYVGSPCLFPVILSGGKVHGSAFPFFCYFPCFMLGLPWSLGSIFASSVVYKSFLVFLGCSINGMLIGLAAGMISRFNE